MTVVAIHQPNYIPWLGYFHKLARADIFVFLDDVQFSKGSYINRVQIRRRGARAWLTQPVSVSLGQPINAVALARPDWARAHLDSLRGAYGHATMFGAVWPDLEAIFSHLPGGDLATVNQALVEAVAARLGISVKVRSSSAIPTGSATADDRLVAIVAALAPGGTYLSGQGGSKYQDADKFAAAGLTLAYTGFEHPAYDQGQETFVPGLSVLDAVFHLGWEGAAALIAR